MQDRPGCHLHSHPIRDDAGFVIVVTHAHCVAGCAFADGELCLLPRGDRRRRRAPALPQEVARP